MSVVITINDADISEQDKAMLQNVLGPVANALVEALKPQLEAMHNEVKASYHARDNWLKEYNVANERRIVLENEHASLVASNSQLKAEVDVLTAERDNAKENAQKWETEALELVRTTDETLAKLRRERDQAKEDCEKLASRLGTIATRMHDMMLLLGNS